MNNRLSLAQRWFKIGCLFELSLLVLAWILGWLFRHDPFQTVRWNAQAIVVALIAIPPLLALFFWMLRSHLSPLARIRAFLDDAVRPIFGEWSIGQLALISILAGLCEEALFRGAIQGILSEAIGRLPALVLASLLFGAAHYITVGYAVLAALIGAYLGALWLATDNLLVPILVHVLYDLIALIYFLRIAK